MNRAAKFSNNAAVIAAARRAAQNLVPPPDILPSVWAEQNVTIPVGNAKPGPIRFDNAPYQRGMLDVIKQPGVRRVSYKMAAQTGKTTVQQCITGYFIDHEPRSQIFAQPSQGDMQTFIETKLRPMLDANPSISRKMAKQRGRVGVNNSRIISYVGGWLMFSWAGSPKTARGRSAPVTQADEVNGMPPTPEGNFVELLAQRGATFGDDRLDIRSSTPTFKGGPIDVCYEEGDQRRYYVPCPHCDHAQYLRWECVTWKGRQSTGIDDAENDRDQPHEPETAGYTCEACGVPWTDGERVAAIRTAESKGHGWKATKPFKGHASLHGPEMLSTFRLLRDIVQSYLDKLAIGDLQSFVNVSLAESYEETGERANASTLMDRAEIYHAPLPAGVLALTAGVDMQNDRLECELVGWGEADESWSIDYQTFWGDPLTSDPWDELEEYLSATWLHETGAQLPIIATCVDTGGTGGTTQAAYEWLRGKTGRRIFGIKGVPGFDRPIVAAPSRKQSGKTARKIDLFLVGADEAKLTVMRRLAIDKPGPGYCHFPDGREAEWFHQLTAEKLLTRYVKGFPVREWFKTRKRNEALDCRVYALAALKIANPSMRRAAERLAKLAPSESPNRFHVEPSAKRQGRIHVAANDNQPKEKPQEETRKAVADTVKVKRSAALIGRKGRKNWVKNW